MQLRGNRKRFILLILKCAERSGDRAFARCFNYFAHSRFWQGESHPDFDFDSACAASRRERMAMRSHRIHRLLSQRYVQRTDWSRVQNFGPALHLGVHNQPALMRLTLFLAGVPRVTQVRRWPERGDRMASFHPSLQKTEMIPVEKGVIDRIHERIEAGSSVTLAPDAPGNKIIATCFRLAERGTPIVFEYPTVDADGMPRVYRQRYDGPADTAACAEGFRAFLGKYHDRLGEAELVYGSQG